MMWKRKKKQDEPPAPEPPKEVKPQVTVYNCMMDVFRDAMFTKENQPEWYEDVNNEYISLRENKNNSYILDLMKEITEINAVLFIVQTCLSILHVKYVRDLVNELRIVGCTGRFDWSKKDQYYGDLKAAASRSKRLVSQKNRLQEELDAFIAKHGGADITPDYFDDWAVELSKFMGYNVRLDQTTVSVWVKMMNKYDLYLEVINADKNNLLSHGK